MHDNIKSKKLWFSVGAIGSMFGFALLTAKIQLLTPLFDSFVGGVVAVAGLYLTGNIANKWVAGKADAAKAAAPAVAAKKQGLQGEPVEEAPPEE